MTPSRSFLLIVLTAALVLGACGKAAPPSPVAINQAIQDGKVQAKIVASDDSGDSTTITLTRPNGVTGTFVVVIPSGTVLYGTDGQQRLITAASVTVVLSDDNPSVDQQVATFCMDEFAATPPSQAVLSFAPPDGGQGVTTEETEPLHKLVDCMAPSTQPFGDKQAAVWAVSGDLLSKTPAEALSFLTDGFVSQMSVERRKQLEAKRADAGQRFSLLSSEKLDQLMEAEYQQGMPQLREIAADKAKQQLDALLHTDKDLLMSCGYSTENAPLFG